LEVGRQLRGPGAPVFFLLLWTFTRPLLVDRSAGSSRWGASMSPCVSVQFSSTKWSAAKCSRSPPPVYMGMNTTRHQKAEAHWRGPRPCSRLAESRALAAVFFLRLLGPVITYRPVCLVVSGPPGQKQSVGPARAAQETRS
jgi:hypothetical protein